MKKLMSLALLLVLATALLCGCTDNTPTSTEPNTEAVSGTSSVDANTENSDDAETSSSGESSDSGNDTASSGESTATVNDNATTEKNTESVSNTASADTTSENTDGNTTPSTENKESDSSAFPEVKASPENINVYRQEVKKRLDSLGEDEFFLSDKEWEAISNSEHLTGGKTRTLNGFKAISESLEELYYIYPVVYRDGDMLVLWHTTEFGELQFENLDKNGTIESSKGGKVHLANSEEEIVTSEFTLTTTYIQKTGEFKVWEFGEVTNTCSVPKNSIFCGLSFMEGYIFINGADVYAINAAGSLIDNGTVECIAHNVKEVIDTDYKYSIDASEQPLFLMKDGSVKCYIGWLDNENIASDDPAHLFDV